jgi:hypothetical protein
MNFKSWLILSETITVKDQEFRDPLNALKHIQKTHPNPENLVVTFTAIDKVGINPKSTYKTPFGVYFYPLDYVITNQMRVEFAGEQPYINVCEFARPEKILHMTSDVNIQKGLELLNVFPKEEVDLAIQNVETNYKFRSNYSKLWLVTRSLSRNKPVGWNANLRKCGIDGFVDHGTGTIHENERTQGVVFTGNALKRILVIPQALFTKQGESMPVRKSLPDPNKFSVEQLENILKNRNLSDNDFLYLLSFAPDQDEMVKFLINKIPELSDDYIVYLINSENNKDKKDRMIEIIIKYKTELSDNNLFNLLNYASDKEEIARQLGPKNINKLSAKTVNHLFYYTSDKERMANILGSENINKLIGDNDRNYINWLFANGEPVEHKEGMKQILRKYYTGKNQELISLLGINKHYEL